MNKYLLLIAFTLFSVTFYAQTSFKKGYYINTSGERHEGLILDADWKNNPLAFEFRSSENETARPLGIDEVSVFEIYDVGKYVKAEVAIDISSESMSELSETKEPEFEERLVFLKVLAEGALNLYFYRDDNLRRYFYKTGDAAIEQLVYKSYKTPDNRVVANYAFRGQLWDACKCEGMTFDDVRGLDYTKRDLMGFVKKYHDCKPAELTIYERSEKRSPLHLAIRPRVTYASLSTENSLDQGNERDFDFGGQWGFGLGVELEYALPFNNDKWRLFLEPTYRSYKAEKTKEVDRIGIGPLTAEVDYTSVEIPVGLRHYFYLNERSQFFLNVLTLLDVPLSGGIEYYRESGSAIRPVETTSSISFGLGMGYKFDRIHFEARYASARDIFNNKLGWKSEYPSFSFIVGYTLF